MRNQAVDVKVYGHDTLQNMIYECTQKQLI